MKTEETKGPSVALPTEYSMATTVGILVCDACKGQVIRLFRVESNEGKEWLCRDCCIGQGKAGVGISGHMFEPPVEWTEADMSTEEPVTLSKAEPVGVDGLTEKEALVKQAQDALASLLECERRLHRRSRFGHLLGDALAAFLVLLVAATLAGLWYKLFWLGWAAR